MVVRKVSVSLSAELDATLRALAQERAEDVSPLVEVLLREHWLVVSKIQERRGGSRIEVPLAAQLAKRIWEERVAREDIRRTDDEGRAA